MKEFNRNVRKTATVLYGTDRANPGEATVDLILRVGSLGVHTSLRWSDQYPFTVTHLPSGLAIDYFPTKSGAITFATRFGGDVALRTAHRKKMGPEKVGKIVAALRRFKAERGSKCPKGATTMPTSHRATQ